MSGRKPVLLAAFPFAVAGFLMSYRPAIAAEPAPAEIAAARRLFAEARAAEDAEDWTTAASKIKEAISIKETPGLRFHLAYCEEHLGMLVEALVDYERAEEAARSKNEEVEQKVGPRKEALRRRTPTVTILLVPDVSDAELTIDGRAVAPALLGNPVPQNPGRHRVVASAPGRTPYSADLMLAETDSIVVTVSLQSPPPVGSESVAPQPPVQERWPVRTYVLIGEAAVSVAMLGVGIGYMLSASAAEDRRDEYRSMLPPSRPGYPDPCWGSGPLPQACADLDEAVTQAKDRRFISKIGFVGAGVGAAAFAATWLLWSSPSPKRAVVPILNGGMAGLYVVSVF